VAFIAMLSLATVFLVTTSKLLLPVLNRHDYGPSIA
jgi:hypothetical protein